MYDVVLEFPKMKVGVTVRDGYVVGIKYLPLSAPSVAARNSLAEEAAKQLAGYRDNPDTVFDLPVVVEGTPLQKAVWQAMCAIPRGRTRTYRDIASSLAVSP